MAKKFYVVWAGRKTGVFTDWSTTQQLVDKFPGARFKSFPTRLEAEQAFAAGQQPEQSSDGRVGSAKKNVAQKKIVAADVPIIDSAAKKPAVKFDVQIYCDGACEPNPGECGCGIAIYRDGKVAELLYGLYNANGTNNTAELSALHHALLIAEQEIAANRTVEVLSDSMYAINCIKTWGAGWEKQGWRRAGGDIKNLELIKALYTLYNRIKLAMTLSHISGHMGHEGNELADRMAMLAAQSKETSLLSYPKEIDVAQILKMRAG